MSAETVTPEDPTMPLTIRVPKSLLDRAEAIASESELSSVVSKLDVIRLAIEKGLPIAAEMMSVKPD